MAKIRKQGEVNDYGFEKTDKALKELEARLSSLYSEATKDMQAKLDKFLEQYYEADKEKYAQMMSGSITPSEYTRWKNGKIFMSNKMRAQIDSLTQDLVNTDKLAVQMINGEVPQIYVTNFNFQGFKAETMARLSGIDYSSFTVYNANAVARIAVKNPDLLPAPNPKLNIPKDKRWNKNKINSAIQQGILQGEPIDKIADRLQQVTDMDKTAAIRNARTALIGAQNAGRNDASKKVNKSGIEMVDVWSCIVDARTRDTHLEMGGQQRGEDGYFTTFRGDKLEYPADPNCRNAAEIYNCRCRLNSYIKQIDHSKDDELYEQMMKEQYYDDWLRQKEREQDKDSRAYMKKLEKEFAKAKQEDLKKRRRK